MQLELALLNLVTNAIDAMVEGGTLTLTLSRHGDGIRLEVGDSGPGVPEALHAHHLRALGHDQAVRPGHRPRAWRSRAA